MGAEPSLGLCLYGLVPLALGSPSLHLGAALRAELVPESVARMAHSPFFCAGVALAQRLRTGKGRPLT